MLNKKIRKLVRNPNLFFSDMALKQSRNLSRFKVKKKQGHYQYTVVSAVYNVEKYLDDYFKSMIKQRLSFKNNIHLILVDDGSTDNSAEIIKRWEKKYPNNITYLWKENGGQASARNLGLQHVKTEWVTFVDPDDFLDLDCLKSIDQFIFSNQKVSMVAFNLVFYKENTATYINSHPLKFKFNKTGVYKTTELGNKIQLSASSAFFKSNEIINNSLEFDNKVKPNFEDGKFIANYLLSTNNGLIGFIREAKYYYRKREDATSTLDKSWQDERKFFDVLKHGYLDTLKTASSYGHIPAYLQNTILYDLIWHIKKIVNHDEVVSFLNNKQKENYIKLLHEIFNYIDSNVILDFNLAGCWFYHKVGLLSLFKNDTSFKQIVYIEDIDLAKNLISLRYFSGKIELESIQFNGKDTIPAYAKTSRHDFLTETFVLERKVWVKLPTSGSIQCYLNGTKARISLGGKHYGEIDCKNILNTLKKELPCNIKNNKYSQSWLFMDRDIQADDNAEHLYRYVKNEHPNQEIYFVLQRNSHDWDRLYNDKFNLIEFGSDKHEELLRGCAKLISSHADKYVTNYLGPQMLHGRHFVFLQHGITKDDISNWLNRKEQINCFITATKPEFHSISNNNSKYKYGKKELALTGFPRHDNLLKINNNNEKLILIMPTWRQSIVGKTIGTGNSRAINTEFINSKFSRNWCGVLKSKTLKELSKNFNYKIVFFPHANIQPYLSMMDIPDYIETVSHSSGSIQALFAKATFMITDYSSVAFEMAVQGKTVIYYQFDEDEVFSGSHIYSRGYFDYRRDGFGPVVTDEESLLKEIELILKKNGQPSERYNQRIESTFPFRDGKNCQRTYEAIVALDKHLPGDFIDRDILIQYAEQATDFGDWALAEDRWRKTLALNNKNQSESHSIQLSKALINQRKINQAEELLSECTLNSQPYEHTRLRSLIATSRNQWSAAVKLLETLPDHNTSDCLIYLRALAEQGLKQELNDLVANWSKREDYDVIKKFATSWLAGIKKEYLVAIDSISEITETSSIQQLQSWQAQLLLSRWYREFGDLDSAHGQLIAFEEHSRNNPACRIEIAKLAATRKDFAKVIRQLEQAYPDIIDMPESEKLLYLEAKSKTVPLSEALTLAYQYKNEHPNSLEILEKLGELNIKLGNWQSATDCFISVYNKTKKQPYRLAYTLRMQGKLTDALSVIQPLDSNIASFEELELAAEITQLMGNWDLAGDYLTKLLSLHSDKCSTSHTEQWRTAVLMQKLSIQNIHF
ncbi:CDP-glycerol glycerophosphotransferase family protein [Plesiomonas sp.]|uniref:CDP-glycerol glycerophosphotransferase family protein n=1 Tax=Plesiomonas sp. TaxID=2486279 RepID=UPI003F30CE8F